MPPKEEAAVDTKSQRAKIPKSDFAHPDHPDGPKYPITTQQQVHSAAKLLGKIPDEATKAKVKARIKRIANRKGFALPKAWANEKTTKKKEAVTLSDDDVRYALQRALRDDVDPDGDGDDDRADDAEPWERPYCYVSDVFSGNGTFVYSFDGDDDDGDDGLYMRSFTLDPNGEATLGADISRVVRNVTYVPYEEQADDATETFRSLTNTLNQNSLVNDVRLVSTFPLKITFPPAITLTESTTIREAFTEWGPLYEADATLKGKVRGVAITPGFNKQGYRYYPKEVLAESVSKLIGKKMYIDHPGRLDEKNKPERGVMEAAAVIDNAWVDTDGAIQYDATVFDPAFDSKLAMMRERGVLGAIGTSINYQGVGKENAVVDGRKTCLIEQILDFNSLDFVTEAGAGGTVAALESAAVAATQEELLVNEEVKKLIEELKTQNERLLTRVEESDKRVAESDRKRVVSETKADIRALCAESVLPEQAHEAILKAFEGAEDTEGVAEAIEEHVAYLKALGVKMKGEKGTETTTPQRKRGVVLGLGGTRTRENEEVEKKPAPKYESATDWLGLSVDQSKGLESFFIG